MITFHEPLDSGLPAEYFRDVKLGEMFNHMRQRDDHLVRVFG